MRKAVIRKIGTGYSVQGWTDSNREVEVQAEGLEEAIKAIEAQVDKLENADIEKLEKENDALKNLFRKPKKNEKVIKGETINVDGEILQATNDFIFGNATTDIKTVTKPAEPVEGAKATV